MILQHGTRIFGIAALAVAAFAVFCAPVSADGGESGLGAPSVAVGGGSGIVAAGVGLETEPGVINLNVPGNVVQAFLYWSGEGLATGDDTIEVEVGGNSQTRSGTLIGGPELFFSFAGNDFYASTYRDDVTDLVQSGANALTVSGLDFGLGFPGSGAGLLVIFEDGPTVQIDIRDGQDLAFAFFAPPLDATVPVDYAYASSAADRSGTLTIMASSVGEGRPNIIRVSFDDGSAVDHENALSSNDGPLWDTLSLGLTIPANTSGMSAEVISWDDPSEVLPASLTWIVGALTVAPGPSCGDGNLDPGEECDDGNNEDGDGCSANCTIEEEEGAGCTPGFWKQEQHFEFWTGFAPGDSFDTVFMVTSTENWTLLEALKAKGGGENALGRHAVAALLNASNPDVDYKYDVDQVKAMVQAAYASGDFESIKDGFEEQNELGCTAKGDSDEEDEDEDGGDTSSSKTFDVGDGVSLETGSVPNGGACGALGMLCLPLTVLGLVGTSRVRR